MRVVVSGHLLRLISLCFNTRRLLLQLFRKALAHSLLVLLELQSQIPQARLKVLHALFSRLGHLILSLVEREQQRILLQHGLQELIIIEGAIASNKRLPRRCQRANIVDQLNAGVEIES